VPSSYPRDYTCVWLTVKSKILCWMQQTASQAVESMTAVGMSTLIELCFDCRVPPGMIATSNAQMLCHGQSKRYLKIPACN